MAAYGTLTRSYSQRHPRRRHSVKHATQSPEKLPQQPQTTRMKRPLEAIDSNLDAQKKAKITVEILAGSLVQSSSPPKTITVKAPAATVQQTGDQQGKNLRPGSAAHPPTNSPKGLTRHQTKLKNGIQHELDRLQPSGADASSVAKDQGRKLRSQEATRFKSELSAYFPDYDEVIGNDPKEHRMFHHTRLHWLTNRWLSCGFCFVVTS